MHHYSLLGFLKKSRTRLRFLDWEKKQNKTTTVKLGIHCIPEKDLRLYLGLWTESNLCIIFIPENQLIAISHLSRIRGGSSFRIQQMLLSKAAGLTLTWGVVRNHLNSADLLGSKGAVLSLVALFSAFFCSNTVLVSYPNIQIITDRCAIVLMIDLFPSATLLGSILVYLNNNMNDKNICFSFQVGI